MTRGLGPERRRRTKSTRSRIPRRRRRLWRARARRERRRRATRREDREATARSRARAAVAAEVARLARVAASSPARAFRGVRGPRLGGGSKTRREIRRLRLAREPRRVVPASSARRRATDLVFFAGKGDAAARVFETSRKQRRTKRVDSNRRRLGDEDPTTQKTRSTKKNQPADRGLPARARRVLDLAWNPSATTPDGASSSLPAEDVSAFGPPTPKPPSLLPFSPANADACARAGDSASSRRLRDWCAYAGLAARARGDGRPPRRRAESARTSTRFGPSRRSRRASRRRRRR